MKTIRCFMGWLVIVFLFVSSLAARENPRKSLQKKRQALTTVPNQLSLDHFSPGEPLLLTAEADTFLLGAWDFESIAVCDPQGWISVDRTVQDGCYFHIEDFAGLAGGDFGRLVPLQGNQSLWCGARPDAATSPLCNYAVLPGYGNGWDQSWCFDCVGVPDTEAVSIDYLISWDTEAEYDFVYVEYATKSTCDSLQSIDDIDSGDWNKLVELDGIGAKQLRSDTIPSGHQGAVKIRFHFVSDNMWSDEDGVWNTDGAVVLDSITVWSASAVYDFEDFEDESPGGLATTDGNWECCVRSGFGDYAGLYSGVTLLQEDPCRINMSCIWSFINGSTDTYACGGHPEMAAVPFVPYGEEPNRYICNEIWSPMIEWTGSGSEVELRFDVYRDLQLYGLVFYVWHVRSNVDGCPGRWRDRNYIYYGRNKDWLTDMQNVSDLIDPNASHVQIALGVKDMCPYWCDIYGYGSCHSHAPLFDNVTLRRIDNHGPIWNVDPVHLFQDNFASDGTLTGTVRADMAEDIMPNNNPAIRPGDSVVVSVSGLENGIGTCPYTGGPAVYLFVFVQPEYQAGKGAAALSGDPSRWPLVDSMAVDGDTWYILRMDTVFADEGGARMDPVPNQFCVDLNDHLFTPGDTVSFFFEAVGGPPANNSTYWSEFTGTNTSITQVAEDPMEFTCLPAFPYSDILYVDDYDGMGAEAFFTLPIIFIDGRLCDRFDIRGPASNAGNGLGARVVDVSQQLIPNYKMIIWNSGNVERGTIGDGTGNPEKSDDFGVLYEFLDQHTESYYGAGIYFSGDNIAEEWEYLTGSSAQSFRNEYMPHILIAGNHIDLFGNSPLVIGTENSCFDNWYWGPDTLVAFGGCPTMNHFDVIEGEASTTVEMVYESPYSGSGAVLHHETTNALGNPAGVILSGFSFHRIRDDRPIGWLDRIDHLRDVYRCFFTYIDEVEAIDDPVLRANTLAQNHPNPFNPVTTIRYSIKDFAHVSLKIYNAAGQLVKTLVNDAKQPGMIHEVHWNGRSNSGSPVASGVYFYKLVTKDFSKTRKMVLLK